ncbi:MAG: 2-oxoacid:acceptor oxidoreductase subunit alpha [Desulfurococcales archaeon]|nr:2-oxoacid:acceptor oxidoreductase subunit alpha [Desulfurococcales archaeon]
MVDLTFIIGGPQGGGIESAGQIALKTFVMKGYHVLGTREYQSNIMGAHSYYMVRVREDRPGSVRLPVDMVIALDAESVLTHFHDVKRGGFLLYDSGTVNTRADKIASMPKPLKQRLKEEFSSHGMDPTVANAVKLAESEGVKAVGLPLRQLLKTVAERSKRPLASVSKTINTMGLSAGLYLLGVELDYIKMGIRVQFAGKAKVIEPNIVAAEASVDYVREVYGDVDRIPDGPSKAVERMIASGNDLVAMGKLVAGIGVQAYYPITPSSDEALYLERHRYYELDEVARERLAMEKAGIVVVQAEDELSAANMIIGAAAAGARSSTTTSGPGFSLMNEAMSLAIMTETPVVFTIWMRAGPSTGMPTREGQQDLLQAIFSGHGDNPKIVIASGDHIEAYYDAATAFNLAERYQTPVVHVLDKYLASSMVSIDREELDPSRISIDRGALVDDPGPGYLRYKITDNGISPRARVGTVPMVITGLEHMEDGFVTEDPVVRDQMMEKRRRKWMTIEKEVPESERARYYGAEDPEILLVSWGSTKPIILEALRELEAEGLSIGFLQIRMFSPFPVETVGKLVSRAKTVIDIEQNDMLQASLLVSAYTGYRIRHAIVKLNGRPLFDVEVVHGVKRILETGEERVVVKGGA